MQRTGGAASRHTRAPPRPQVVFSPDERFVVTWSGFYHNRCVPTAGRRRGGAAGPPRPSAHRFLPTAPPCRRRPERACIVWDVRTKGELRSFRQARAEDEAPDCRWSPDSRYLARMGVDPATGGELVQVT